MVQQRLAREELYLILTSKKLESYTDRTPTQNECEYKFVEDDQTYISDREDLAQLMEDISKRRRRRPFWPGSIEKILTGIDMRQQMS